jgi:hypothetical protein
VSAPDGSIVVPPHLAREVLRLLTLGLTEQAQRDGLPVSEVGRRLLWDLAAAADQHDEAASFEDETSQLAPVSLGAVVDIGTVAERMGCSQQYARRLASLGRLDARKVGGRWIVQEGAST